MRTVETKIYKLDELSVFAQEKAHNEYLARRDYDFSEAMESIKEGLKHFGFKLVDWDIDYYRASNAWFKIEYTQNHYNENDREDLEGARLWKCLHNQNFLQYFCKYDRKYKPLLDGNCPFTGITYDEDFLYPIKEFMQRPSSVINFKELMKDCVRSVLKSIEEEYDYQSSFEYFKEEAEANGYEFHDDGSRY